MVVLSEAAKIAEQVIDSVCHRKGISPAATDPERLECTQQLCWGFEDGELGIAFPYRAGLHVLGLKPNQFEDGGSIKLAFEHRRKVAKGDDWPAAKSNRRLVGAGFQCDMAFSNAAILHSDRPGKYASRLEARRGD
jgi:hypothetical protein